MRRLAIWGSGGHGQVVRDVALATGAFDEIVFYDDRPGTDAGVLSGGIEAVARRGIGEFIVAIGSNEVRARCYEAALRAGLRAATCVHPSAVISGSAVVGAGTVAMARAVIQARARVGENCIVNTGAIVEHDCAVGDHSHLSPAVTLGGAVRVGRYAHLGIGAIAIPGARIGDRAVVGAGAVVLKEVPDGVTAVGVPARVLRKS